MLPMVTFSFHGDNGSYYGSQHIEHYTERAKGGAGLIIIQATNVLGASVSTEMWSSGSIEALTQITANVHSYGTVVMMQLAVYDDMNINLLSKAQIHEIQAELKQAAINACDMGFDGVEYHFAHGFTLCRFLDVSHNHRSDEFGGSAENRARILTEILPVIRENTRSSFIVSVRMGEYLPEGKDGIEMAQIFEIAGIDMLNISFGMQPPVNPIPDNFRCSSMTYSGCKIKKEVNIPVIAVNEIRTEEQVRFLIENDYADFAGIGRGMLADAEFANHVMNSEPVNMCCGCKNCLWYTEHKKCPAKKK
jgi:NADPH2 dehydrogenase